MIDAEISIEDNIIYIIIWFAAVELTAAGRNLIALRQQS